MGKAGNVANLNNTDQDQKKGIIHKIQEKEKEFLNKSSELCAGQKANIEALRNKYFLKDNQKGNGYLSTGEKIIAAASIELNKPYLTNLKEYYKPFYPLGKDYKAFNRIAYIDITRWVIEKNEDSLEKLVNVYQCIHNKDCSLALIFHRSIEKCTVTLAISNNGKSPGVLT